jgi:parallel beta-helix repeat protein
MRMRPRNVTQVMMLAVSVALLWAAPSAVVHRPPQGRVMAASGTVYFVATTGSDSNLGTEGLPWRTIQKAADTLVAGDTVYIKAGTYPERVVPQHSGTAGNPIVYAAYPGHTVTLDGATVVVPQWSGLFDISEKHHIRLSGLRILNAGPNVEVAGILVDGSSHVIVEHNHVSNTSSSGIGVWDSYDVIIDSNEVERACYNGSNESISVGGTDTFEVRHNHVHHSRKEGICPKDGSSNGKVFGNEVHHTEAVGIYIDAWDKHTHHIEVYDNVVHDVAANGFSVASEQGGLLENVGVYNNIAYNNKWVGLHLFECCAAEHPVRNVRIVNNTFYRNGWEPWGGGILLENPQAEDVVIRNNICSQNLSFQIAVDARVPLERYAVDHNLIDGYRGGEDGEIYGDDYVQGDPLFVDAASADFHLRSNSPAIDRGSPLAAPATDFDGQSRPYGAGYDIGADEHVAFAGIVYLPVIVKSRSASRAPIGPHRAALPKESIGTGRAGRVE